MDKLVSAGENQALIVSRRGFLAFNMSFLIAAVTGVSSTANDVAYGPVAPFSFELLRQRARELAKQNYLVKAPPASDITASIDFDKQQKIKFHSGYELWRDSPHRFTVRFFHLHKYVRFPVKIHVVSNQTAREYLFSKELFDYDDTGLAAVLPDDLGFAGFRVLDRDDGGIDWLAFQGASYFRCSGEDYQYGASARGVAVDTASDRKEEFPRFLEFWLEPSDGATPALTIYALLDGPSLTGAYRFDVTKGNGETMDVHVELFMRDDIARLGIAPLTSMYWYGENERRKALDWRPEIHDSDGLAMWTGNDEHIFRPLVDPPSVQVNSFLDNGPKGFGLMQRDRDFDHYQDDGAFYERRPSIWVEPKGDWGEGAVQLVEIPTDDEIYDNIVAYWQPRKPVRKGDALAFDYRLYWQSRQPFPPESVALVVATRIGRGGVPGQPRPKDDNRRKFVIDFEGGPLATMKPRYDLTPVITVSRGSVSNSYVVKVVGTDRWRAVFDLDVAGAKPVDMRCFLRLADQTLTETWLYQYFPAP